MTKTTLALMAIALSLFSLFLPNAHKCKIIKRGTDERGLTSVVYTEGKDTFALDYLTKHELDSITNK